MSKQSNNHEVAAAQQAAKDAQYAAHVAHTYFKFLTAHKDDAEGGIAGNDANRAILESFIDQNLLDASKPESWEIGYLAVGSQLLRVKNPKIEKPEPPPTPAPPAVQLTEDDQLREILRSKKDAPAKEVANMMRARLRVKETHASARPPLPAKYDRDYLRRCSASEQRILTSKFGAQALTDRLQGKN